MSAVPLPWPVLAGSPVDFAWAQINLATAHMRWASSMTSEVFEGVVTFCTECYIAAQDEFSAASKRRRCSAVEAKREATK